MAFVVSEGALQSVTRPAALAAPRLQLSADYSQAYSEIWRTQPAVRTVVTFLARNIAQLGLHSFERVSDDERRRLQPADHPVAALFKRPNPRTTRYRLLNDLVHDLGIYDCAYQLKVGTKVAPSLLRLPPEMTKPTGGSWLWADGFEVRGVSGAVTYPADRVVHFHGYNPTDSRTGSSPIEALRRTLAEEYQASRMREQVLRNGARMSGYIKRPAAQRGNSWSDPARDRFKAEWQAQYAGEGPQAGGTPILEDGMEFVAASQTAQQLEYVSSRKLTREEVASAYFIPPPMVGILDHATFGNIEEQHKMLYQDTLGPWLAMIEAEYGLQLLPDLDPDGRVYVEFNLHEKLKGSFEEQAQQLSSSVGAPWLTRNEARARQNLPPIDGGDELVVPLNVLVGGLASPRDTAPPAIEAAGGAGGTKMRLASGKSRPPATYVTKAEQVLTSFFKRQRSVILTRLGAKADADVWDDDRWNAELSDDLFALASTVSTLVAGRTLESIGLDPGEYDVDRTLAYLRAVSDRVSGSINATTKASILAALAAEDGEDEDRLEGVRHVFDVAESARASSAGMATVTTIAGFASIEAGKQLAGTVATKTWVTTSGNPRSSHAAMNGETVPVGEAFSNGAQYPADGVLDVDEVAGCACDVIISVPG